MGLPLKQQNLSIEEITIQLDLSFYILKCIR